MSNTPEPLPNLDEKDIARFWSRVDIRGPEECWPWNGGAFAGGYGQFKAKRRNLRASRVAFFLTHGHDAKRLVLHSCDNPPCCNGAHLFEGDESANSADCKSKGRLNTAAGERHGSHTKPESWARGETVHGSKLTAEAVIEIRSLYLSGSFTHQGLADRFDVSRRAIGLILKGERWQHIEGNLDAIARVSQTNQGRSGERHPGAKLTEQDVRDIRALRADGGLTHRAIATRFNVSPELISAIVNGRVWRHVR